MDHSIVLRRGMLAARGKIVSPVIQFLCEIVSGEQIVRGQGGVLPQRNGAFTAYDGAVPGWRDAPNRIVLGLFV
jgi:hypothetical protein